MSKKLKVKKKNLVLNKCFICGRVGECLELQDVVMGYLPFCEVCGRWKKKKKRKKGKKKKSK